MPPGLAVLTAVVIAVFLSTLLKKKREDFLQRVDDAAKKIDFEKAES